MNVGHGDSIVVELKTDCVHSFGVIDSNCRSDANPPVLIKLRALGALELSFVLLTHPHADHYGGLEKVLSEYAGKIGGIYTFPIDQSRVRLQKLAEKYKEIASRSGSEDLRSRAVQFVRFLAGAANCGVEWDAPTGLLGMLSITGFPDVEFIQALPHSKVKGRYFQDIDKGTLNIEDSSENDLSLAIIVRYAGVSVLLGGDGTRNGWMEQAARASKAGGKLRCPVVKLPHHGSGVDCTEEVLDILFGPESETHANERIAIISADGLSHPSKEVLMSLHRRGIKPYCTNLSTYCRSTDVVQFVSIPDVDHTLGRFLASVAQEPGRAQKKPCQGEIMLIIGKDGRIDVETEHPNACPLRGSIFSQPARP